MIFEENYVLANGVEIPKLGLACRLSGSADGEPASCAYQQYTVGID